MTEPKNDTQRCSGVTTSVTITPEGGKAEVGECQIVYPPGAVSEPTTVKITSAGRHEHMTDEYLPISPIFICEPAVTFSAPVKIKLPLWCFARDQDVSLSVASQDEENAAFKVIETERLGRYTRSIPFEVMHFSRLWAFTKWLFLNKVEYIVTADLFHRHDGRFTAAFTSVGMSAEADKVMKDAKYALSPVISNALIVKPDDTIGLKMEDNDTGEGRKYFFEPSGISTFTVDEDFAGYPIKYVHFKIDPIPNPRWLVTLQIRVYHCDEIFESIPFNLAWSQAPGPAN